MSPGANLHRGFNNVLGDQGTDYSLAGPVWTARTGSSTAGNGIRQGGLTGQIAIAYGSAGAATTGIRRTIDLGLTWSGVATNLSDIFSGMAYHPTAGSGNGRWLLMGGKTVPTDQYQFSDDNGLTWTTGTLPTVELWQACEYGNGIFMVIPKTAANTIVYTSPDAVTWTARALDRVRTWWGLQYAPDLGIWMAVAVSTGTAAVSTSADNGITWLPKTGVPTVNVAGDDYLSYIVPTSSLSGRVGIFTVPLANNGSAGQFTSNDGGVTWNGTAGFGTGTIWAAPFFGQGNFIYLPNAVTDVVLSYDGVGSGPPHFRFGASTNNLPSIGALPWHGVYFGNGNYAAVTSNGGAASGFGTVP